MAEAGTKRWDLKNYERFIFGNCDKAEPNKNGHWKSFKGEEKLTMSLNDHQLMIFQTGILLEKLALNEAHSNIRGMSRGSILMLIQQKKAGHRRFRIEFCESENGQSSCKECLEELLKYFPIKFANSDDNLHQNGGSMNKRSPELVQTVNSMVKCQDVEETDENLRKSILKCLTDPTFPSFVAKVKKQLESLSA